MQTDFITYLPTGQPQPITPAAWRELMVQLAPSAAKVISDILNDPKASPSVRLRAALAVLKIAGTPEPALAPVKAASTPLPPPGQPKLQIVQPGKTEIPAQSRTMTVRKAPEPGRNSQCPCGSGLKYKRCCANPVAPHAPPIAVP